MPCDLTGISGLLKKIWEWLQGCLDKLIAALTTLFTFLFVPTAAEFQASFDSLLVGIQDKFDLETYENFVNSLKTLESPYPPNLTANILGEERVIINFEPFNKYRDIFFEWIRGYYFIFLIIYNMNFIYKLLRGSSLSDSAYTAFSSRKGGSDE